MENRILVISGGSKGIGKATAEYFAANGYTVYELSRKGESTKSVTHITADISDEVSVENAFLTLASYTDRVDVLINNAGYGISGAVELTDITQAKRMFDVNFFGSITVTKSALPFLRKARGKVINISSVAAPIAIPFQAYYSACKAAINAMTCAMANELKPFGVKVCALMPGDIKTDFTENRVKTEDSTGLYGDRIAKSVAVMEHDEQNGLPPVFISKRLYAIAKKKNPKPLYTAGFKYKLFVMLSRLLPCRFVNFLLLKIYGG